MPHDWVAFALNAGVPEPPPTPHAQKAGQSSWARGTRQTQRTHSHSRS
nr:hypothetical protein [Kibdelosporangium sp. MJ126-NF4]